jgi:ribosome-binding factor A
MQKKSSARSQRVAAEIRKVLSEFFIHNSLHDEKVNTTFFSVTDVVVSSCLKHAKIYFSFFSDSVSEDECLNFLQLHTPHLRHHVGQHIRLKFVPELSFFVDDSFEYTKKIISLLDQCRTF